jgi:hypothetical protein
MDKGDFIILNMTKNKDKKYQDLVLGLLFDGIGMLSFAVPFIGDFSDVIWAPLAGWLMTRLYKGKVGQAAGVFTFIEEIIPGLDVIPSFTIMWIYTYVLKGVKKKTIDVDFKQ